MRGLIALLFLFAVGVNALMMKPKASVPPSEQLKAVEELIVRQGFPLELFRLELLNEEIEVFEIEGEQLGSDKENVIVIRATSGISAASGFNYYLKEYLFIQIAWEGSQKNFQTPLPIPPNKIRVERSSSMSYYKNVCTESYTSAFWGWNEWEFDIDWMALNGINLPLVLIGQEYIWTEVYKELYQFELQDLHNFFVGPAFLAWGHMGNIQGFGGPLPKSFIDSQFDLLKQVLNRMRQLGMTPVLPAFAGFVPIALKEKFPDVEFTQLPSWNGFSCDESCVFVVDSKHQIFQDIGSTFIRKQMELLGTDHYYSTDTFNENLPPTSDPDFLKSVAEAVYQSMATFDPEAIWVMQGWLFYYDSEYWGPDQVKGLLSGVPDDKMIILDLFSDVFPVWQNYESYYGKPFIWSMLHNFGGNLGLYGRFRYVNEEIVKARNAPNTTMTGIGLTMEGINQNYFLYELVAETAWRNDPVDPYLWIEQFVRRRYGLNENSHPAKEAWKILLDTVYDSKTNWSSVTKSVITLRPALNLVREGFMPTKLHYDPLDLKKAWDFLIQSIPTLKDSELFNYDLVDVTTQVLSNTFLDFHQQYYEAYQSGNIDTVRRLGIQMMTLILEMDTILLTNHRFLLGTWIEMAKNLGTTEEEKALFEFNARNQITLWGHNGEINDYASKQWGGLVGNYYSSRWELFFNMVLDSMNNGQPFDQQKFNEEVLILEQEWQTGKEIYPTSPEGNTITVTLALHYKYKTK